MRTIELLLGGIIVASTFVDIFQSVVVPRPTRGSLRLAPFLLDGMWPLWKWIALCAGASGIALGSSVISMFFSLYSSVGHREVLVTMLHNRAGSPPSGVTLLETFARLKMLEELPGFLSAWEEWLPTGE